MDSLAVARDSEMHEATRRMLSVLLRQVNWVLALFNTLTEDVSFLSCMFGGISV